MNRLRTWPPIALGVCVLVGLFLITHRRVTPPPQPEPSRQVNLAELPPTTNDQESTQLLADDEPSPVLAHAATATQLAANLTDYLARPHVRAHEAVLIFKTAEGYRQFLARAAQSGVITLAQIDALNAVRIRVRAYDVFAAELVARAADYGGISANPYAPLPTPPPVTSTTRYIAVGGDLLNALGVPAGTATTSWGQGVTIAILDGGATPDPTLGSRLRYLDIGLGYAGTGAAGEHGTAVAALAAGASSDAAGVAPAATILSIRVLSTDDKSDIFTIAQGIVAAIEAHAQIINLSLGGYATSELLNRAVGYASAHGVVLVAAAGNDGANRLTWPAADPRVVSVGATDGAGYQADFANTGAQLHLTAPGVGIQTAGLNQQRFLFSGTSASAPIVAGAIAVIMSQSPGLTAAEAVEVLKTHANDGGAVGDDSYYGHGALNLGWALARTDLNRSDVAIASHTHNPEGGSLEVNLQNRGAHSAVGYTLTVELNGHLTTYAVPAIAVGGSSTVTLPLDDATKAAPITLRSRLDAPPNVSEVNTTNNTRAGVFDLRMQPTNGE